MGFIIQRCLRLWPVMMLGVLVGFAFHVLSTGSLRGAPALLLSAMLFLPRSGQPKDAIFPLNSVQWSLLFELSANALHVLVLARLSTRKLLVVSGLCWLALAAMSLETGKVDYGAISSGWQFGLLRVGYAYCLGCVLGRHMNVLTKATRTRWWVPHLALALLLFGPARVEWTGGLLDSITLLAFAPVLATAIGARPPLMISKVLCFTGALSWPLYALHFPIFELVRLFAGASPESSLLPAALAIVLSLAVAWMVASSSIAHGFSLSSRWLRSRQATRASEMATA